MTSTLELLRLGQKNEVWSKYCGFLDLRIDEFMGIQERLLKGQMNLLAGSWLGKQLMQGKTPASVQEFREVVPITTYEDYEPYFAERREDVLPQKPYVWAHTSGRSGEMKWIPYTEDAYHHLGERVLSGVILSAARYRGDVRLEEGDTLVYNTPPRPFISGVSLRALAEEFEFHFIPGLDITETLSFQERIEKGFEEGMVSGIDIMGSLAVVMVKMGERFAEGAQAVKFSRKMLNPHMLLRLGRGYLRSKLAGRSMLPKDIWEIKGIPSGGMDISIYRDAIEHYWGVQPYESYGATEEGAIAGQAWNRKDLTFYPDAAFLEFIPEEEWVKWRLDDAYIPRTVLMNEIQMGKRYEVVVSNFFGKPLVRYRLHDLIRFTAFEDAETGVKLPQMAFDGRSTDYIDLAGFTGLIDEKMVWQAIVNSGIPHEDWSIRKEHDDRNPYLHLYIELTENVDCETVRQRVDEEMKKLNSFYSDYAAMIEAQSLRVTLLSPKTFAAYQQAMQKAGADLAHLKPAHMNASNEIINLLMRLSHEQR